jgi:hypothetical protein
MQQIRSTWLKTIGTVKMICFNGAAVVINDPRTKNKGNEPATK